MRRMYSENQIKGFIQESSSEVVEALKGQDISVEGITSKGIANTGGLANIGNVAISGELSVSGDVKVFENIVDSKGHNRFVEGNITTEEITGITYTYAKWSLSGTHLMIVIAGKIAPEATIPSARNLGSISDMPLWILSKIYPAGDTEKQVAVKYADEWVDANTAQTPHLYCGIQKPSSSLLRIAKWGSSFTPTVETYFRIAFDLLIDNESEE